MRVVLPFVFEQLKQEVLDIAGLTIITPSDCQALSLNISRQTKKQISDTTIKRIYGFALSNSVPSLYTLNLLSAYCGYISWDSFCDEHSKKITKQQPKPSSNSTTSIPAILHKTTLNTLQILKNKSVIPYNLTIARDSINEHLEVFTTGDFKATILTSPAGYGKTIGLCHWVESQLNNALVNGSDDVMLFLNSKVLTSLSQGVTLTDWLLALMGLPTGNGHNMMLNFERTKLSKFYLIIDEFDGNAVRTEQADQFFGILLDFLVISHDWPGFKLILTMRSNSWMALKRRLNRDNLINNWFLGFMTDDHNNRNVPLFTINEIKELCRRINPGVQMPGLLHHEVVKFFSYPLFFQYYYQKNLTDFLLDELDHFRIYEVISSYIFDKIYAGKYTTEKILLLRQLLDNGYFKNGKFLIDKLKVYEQLKKYKDAYYDLTSIGFLHEINRSTETDYAEYIEFTNMRLFTATMAAKLLHDFGENNRELCLKISEIIVPEHKVYVLKWCIFNNVKVQKFELFTYLDLVDLSASEKALLLSFLSSLVKRNFLLPLNTEADQIFSTGNQQAVFNYFFGFEFISLEYEHALKDLLKLKLNDTLKIWINTCLSIIYLMQLNSEGVEGCMKILRTFPDEAYTDFQINPLYCIETIYNYLKFGVVTKKALIQITRFIFSGTNIRSKNSSVGSNNVLYLLAVNTLRVSGNERKTIRLINKLKQIHSAEDTFNSTYDFFLQVALAESYLLLGDMQNGLNIYNKLLNGYKSEYLKYTPYMKVRLDFLSAMVAKYTRQIEPLSIIIEKMINTILKSGCKLIKVNTLSLYLECVGFDRTTDMNRSAYLKFKKYLHSSGFNPQSFLFNYRDIEGKITF